MENEKKAVEAQGAKTQKVSKSYTVKQLGEVITKVEGFKYLNETEIKQLRGMQEKVKQAYIKEAFG